MKNIFRLLAALLLLLPALLTPTFAQDKQKETVANIEAHPALWTVHGKVGTAYLLGSIHLLPTNVVWRTPQIEAAMDASDVFVFEIPMDDSMQASAKAYIAAHGMLPKGTTLTSLLPPEALKDYQAALASAHIPAQALDDKRPWLAAIVLQVAMMAQENYSAGGGIDHEVLAIANGRGKTLRHFETVEQQMALLAPPDQNLEVSEFALQLKSFRDQPTAVGAIVDAWAKGDVGAIDRLMNSDLEKTPGAKKVLLDDRNRNWVTQLDGWLAEPHTYFITVGAAHLAGATGVPALLRARGYKVDGP